MIVRRKNYDPALSLRIRRSRDSPFQPLQRAGSIAQWNGVSHLLENFRFGPPHPHLQGTAYIRVRRRHHAKGKDQLRSRAQRFGDLNGTQVKLVDCPSHQSTTSRSIAAPRHIGPVARQPVPQHHHALPPFDKGIFKRPLAGTGMKRADRNPHVGPSFQARRTSDEQPQGLDLLVCGDEFRLSFVVYF